MADKLQNTPTYFIVNVKKPGSLTRLASESGYTVEEIEEYLWNADFSGFSTMKLPNKNLMKGIKP